MPLSSFSSRNTIAVAGQVDDETSVQGVPVEGVPAEEANEEEVSEATPDFQDKSLWDPDLAEEDASGR
tara:strand:- start:40 stop:243 length:204 start_codon:yes stop_codon:yes gene_type:complete